MSRLAEGLVAGSLPAVTHLRIVGMHVGDAGASAIAAALDRGALPRLEDLALMNADIGINDQIVAALLERVDTNDDGVISYREFAPLCYEVLVEVVSQEIKLAAEEPISKEMLLKILNKSAEASKSVIERVRFARRPPLVCH